MCTSKFSDYISKPLASMFKFYVFTLLSICKSVYAFVRASVLLNDESWVIEKRRRAIKIEYSARVC